MKKHLLFINILFFFTASTYSQTEIYSKLSLQIDDPQKLQEYTALGVDFDHFDKIDENHIEIILSESEITILKNNDAVFEVLTKDLAAEFLVLNSSFDPNLFSDNSCQSDGFYFDNFKITDYFTPNDANSTEDLTIQYLNVQLAPNPNNGKFSARIHSKKSAKAHIQITNFLGSSGNRRD